MYLINRTEAVEAIKEVMNRQSNDTSGLNIKYGLYLALRELGRLNKYDRFDNKDNK